MKKHFALFAFIVCLCALFLKDTMSQPTYGPYPIPGSGGGATNGVLKLNGSATNLFVTNITIAGTISGTWPAGQLSGTMSPNVYTFNSPIYIEAVGPGGNAATYPPSVNSQLIGEGITYYASYDLSNFWAINLTGAYLFTNKIGLRDEDLFWDGSVLWTAATLQGNNFGDTNQGFALVYTTNLYNVVPMGCSNDNQGVILVNIVTNATTSQTIYRPHLMTNNSNTKFCYFMGYPHNPPANFVASNQSVWSAVTKDGTWTNYSGSFLLATNENTIAKNLNDPFLLRQQTIASINGGAPTDLLFCEDEAAATVHIMLVYTNLSANMPSQMHLWKNIGTSFGIESPVVLVKPDGNYQLLASGANLPTSSLHPYSFGIPIITPESATPYGWTTYGYNNQAPNTVFPNGTLLAFYGQQAAYIDGLIRTAQMAAMNFNGGNPNFSISKGFIDQHGVLKGNGILSTGNVIAFNIMENTVGSWAIGDMSFLNSFCALAPGLDNVNWGQGQLLIEPFSPTLNGANIELNSSSISGTDWMECSATTTDFASWNGFWTWFVKGDTTPKMSLSPTGGDLQTKGNILAGAALVGGGIVNLTGQTSGNSANLFTNNTGGTIWVQVGADVDCTHQGGGSGTIQLSLIATNLSTGKYTYNVNPQTSDASIFYVSTNCYMKLSNTTCLSYVLNYTGGVGATFNYSINAQRVLK